MGLLGATDIYLYHSISHGIRGHADSRTELLVHSFRGPVYAFLFLTIPFFDFVGFAFWLVIAVLAVDVLISLVDFAIEECSRRNLGGLPTGEYILHILLAMVFGALVMSFWSLQFPNASEAFALTLKDRQQSLVFSLSFLLMGIGVTVSSAKDLLAYLRLNAQVQHG